MWIKAEDQSLEDSSMSMLIACECGKVCTDFLLTKQATLGMDGKCVDHSRSMGDVLNSAAKEFNL